MIFEAKVPFTAVSMPSIDVGVKTVLITVKKAHKIIVKIAKNIIFDLMTCLK